MSTIITELETINTNLVTVHGSLGTLNTSVQSVASVTTAGFAKEEALLNKVVQRLDDANSVHDRTACYVKQISTNTCRLLDEVYKQTVAAIALVAIALLALVAVALVMTGAVIPRIALPGGAVIVVIILARLWLHRPRCTHSDCE